MQVLDLQQSFWYGDVGVINMAMGDICVILHDGADLAEVSQYDLEAKFIDDV